METRVSGDVIILHCAGRLVFGDEAAAFRDRIKNILFGTHQIVVNLSGIEYIDSGGLGTLVGLLASTRNRHGEIKLVHPIQRVVDLLRRTRRPISKPIRTSTRLNKTPHSLQVL
jgi:anti-sigma B factor antagonist